MRTLTCGVALLLAPALLLTAAPDKGEAPIQGNRKATDSAPHVRTAQGALRGQTVGDVDQFLGIPYAAPPVGDLRWRVPAEARQWDGVRDAVTVGNTCVQPASVGAGKAGNALTGSEDCLYLNVYRPVRRSAADPLPVLLFIHGGSNQRGAGSEYDPGEMVAKGGIIAVTINYRLNVFGFLALPSLDTQAGDGSSGNFGLMDQQAAMRWVKTNISAFGGDPSSVTIAGESAGGIDVCAHLASPPASSLFKRAVMQSMYCPAVTHDEALATSVPVAAALGCADSPTAECMRSRSTAEVLQAALPLSVAPGEESGFSASPNSGGSILPKLPADAFRSGEWNQSPVLIGSTRDEAALFVAAGLLRTRLGLSVSPVIYRLMVARRWKDQAPAVMSEYPLDRFPTPFAAYSAEATDDSPLGCQVTSWADLFASITTTYRYEFADAGAPPPLPLNVPAGMSIGAYHGSDLQYLFNMTRLPGPQTDAQKRLSEQMERYWANFVKTGDPNGPGLVNWQPYDTAGRYFLSLTPDGNRMMDNFDAAHHCAFWASRPASNH